MHELSPAFILAPFSCCTDFPTGLLGHFVVACLMHGELSVTEIHGVKTLNSELRSNSQLPACILYGRKNDLIYQVISAPVRGYSRSSYRCRNSCTSTAVNLQGLAASCT